MSRSSRRVELQGDEARKKRILEKICLLDAAVSKMEMKASNTDVPEKWNWLRLSYLAKKKRKHLQIQLHSRPEKDRVHPNGRIEYVFDSSPSIVQAGAPGLKR